MDKITTLDDLIPRVENKKVKLVVAGGNSASVIQSISKGIDKKIIEPLLIGEKKEILELSLKFGIRSEQFEIIDEKEPKKIARRAVELIREKKADLIMKGSILSADYIHAILNKKRGLMTTGNILTHVVVLEIPKYHKLLFISDVGILVQPDLSQKILMLKYCVEIADLFGIEKPKAGILSCIEKPSYKIDSTIDASIIKKMAERNQIKGVEIGGPLALDLAISKKSAEVKKYDSPVAGDCDILIFPNICAGNIFFKTATNFAEARLAAVVMGASVPCIMTSRADSDESKLLSIALAAFLSNKKK